MRLGSRALSMAAGLLALGLLSSHVSAGIHIITEGDTKSQRVPVTALVKTAENGIMLFDTSASMNDLFKDTGVSKLKLLGNFVAKRTESFPELDTNFGVYVYTPWKPIYPVQPINKAEMAKALGTLPAKGGGPTFLHAAFEKLDSVLQPLKGRSAIFLVTDGQYTGEGVFKMKDPAAKARELAKKYDICFYIVSTAERDQDKQLLASIAGVNDCSQVIPLDVWLARPDYNTGALYVVKSTEEVVTSTAQKVVGVKVDPILFALDSDTLRRGYQEEVKAIGKYLNDNPLSYVVIHGYADDQGDTDYNLKLSKRRALAVAGPLRKDFKLPESRMVVMWYGERNPVASNHTKAGKAANRRVEIGIGGPVNAKP